MISHFGLDLGFDNIKIVQLAKDKDQFRLLTAGMIKTPVNSLASDAEKDLVAVAEAIKKLKSEIKVSTNEVVTALPERSVFCQIIEVPKMSEEELAQAIPWEAENLIPQPLAEVSLDWEVIEDEASAKINKTKVFLVASPNKLVNKYLQILKLADLEPIALETETISFVRALKPIFKQGSLILVNLGAKSTDISLISQGNIALTRQIPTAGEAITRALIAALGLDFNTAEEYKKAYGYSTQGENKVAVAIEPILAVIGNEIKKAIHFYQEKGQNSLGLIILSGGTALLPGMAEYFAKSLELEVQIADPFALVKTEAGSQAALKKVSPIFTLALGMAMKES